MFRITCKFQPSYRHLSGASKDAWHFTRGAWVVIAVAPRVAAAHPVRTMPGYISVLCPTRRRVGTRVSPRTLLQEYQTFKKVLNAFGPFDNFLTHSYA